MPGRLKAHLASVCSYVLRTLALSMLVLATVAAPAAAQESANTDEKDATGNANVYGSGTLGALVAEQNAPVNAAVIVGISDYAFVPDVPGAADNATDWYAWLHQARELPLENIHLLRDQEATAEAITDAVTRARKQVGESGTLWFVFVGHGAPTKSGDDGVLVGVDAQANPRGLYARSVAQKTILRTLEGPHQNIVVLDTCFSGKDREGAALLPDLQPLVPTKTPPATRSVVFTAAGAGEFAGPLPAVGRPAFSYLLLGAFKGWADDDGDQQVTAHEAISWSRHVLTLAVRDRRQTPQLLAADGALVIAPASEAGPELATLTTSPPRPAGPATTVRADGQPALPTLEFQLRFEYGRRFLGKGFFEGATVDFVNAELGDSSEFVDLDIGEMTATLPAHYLGIVMGANNEGFGWTVSMSSTFVTGDGSDVDLSANESLSAEDAALEAALRNGHTARVTGMWIVEMGIEPQYQFRWNTVTLGVSAGLGGHLGGASIDNGPAGQPLGELVQNESVFLFDWTLLGRTRAEWRFGETWAASLGYMYHVQPFDSHTILVGLGPSTY